MFDNLSQATALMEQLKQTDEQFAAAVQNNKKKSIDGFMDYFFKCALDAYTKSVGRKNGYMQSIPDECVSNLMIHYWTEAAPKVGDIDISDAKFKAASTAAKKPAKGKAATPAAQAAPPTPKPTLAIEVDEDFDIDEPATAEAPAPTEAPAVVPMKPAMAKPSVAVPEEVDDDFELD